MTVRRNERGARRRASGRRTSQKRRIKTLEDGHRQWEHHAGFAADGKTMLTLRDLVAGVTSARPAHSLTPDQQQELTLARLRRFPNFKLAVIGRRHPVSQRTAIKEVKARTPLGRFLIETEQKVIRLLVERARKARGST